MKKMERQTIKPTEWDISYANHIYDKRFVSRIYRGLLHSVVRSQ